jgi:CheY-like chemotaxis protein
LPGSTLGDYFGFPVAQVIAQSHGGDLRSTRPRGLTRFEVELPVNEDTAEETEPVAEHGAVRMLTCLLIEPDIISQRKLIAMLAARGHRGIPAATAEDAADLVQRMQFDVLFCASRLPGLTWLELYHRIRRRIGAFALISDVWDAEAAQTLGQGEGKVLTRPVADRDLDDFLGFVEVRLAAARG